jgi:hypothetical protein
MKPDSHDVVIDHSSVPDPMTRTGPARVFWTRLVPGDLVDVWRGSRWVSRARVDDLTGDGTVVWLVDLATGCRTLHLDRDGLTLTPCPLWPARHEPDT